MNRFVKSLVMLVPVVALSRSLSHAQGWLPPPPPPTGFYVTVSTIGFVAHWDPIADMDVILTADGSQSYGAPANTGVFVIPTPLDSAVPHHLSLVNKFPWGVNSAPVAYSTPASVLSVPKQVSVHVIDSAATYNMAANFQQTITINNQSVQVSQELSADTGKEVVVPNAGPAGYPITLSATVELCTIGGCQPDGGCSLTYTPQTDNPTFQVVASQWTPGCTITYLPAGGFF
jgi:hypothetical protein